MKHFLYAFAFLAAIVGCQRMDPESNPENQPEQLPEVSPDSAYVSLKAALDFSSEPLTRAVTQDGLYALRVYQITSGGPVMTAYGTFDDLGKAIVKMAKMNKYGIDLAYIPDGKNRVHKFPDGHYGVPFDAVWVANGSLNRVMYTKAGDQPVWPLTYGVVQETGITDYMVQSNNWSTVTRYQGVAFCDPASQATVEVKLYAQMIGFRISITDFTKGAVTLSGTYGHQYTVQPDENKSAVIDVVVCLELMPSVSQDTALYSQEGVDYEQYIMDKECYHTVQLIYNDGAGSDVVLYNNVSFYSKRNIRYTMSFSLSDAIRNGGISAQTIDEGLMTEVPFPL